MLFSLLVVHSSCIFVLRVKVFSLHIINWASLVIFASVLRCDSQSFGPVYSFILFVLFACPVSDRLNKILTKKLELPINGFTFWTDSMTVIRYILNELKRFHTYVANRIAVREESNLPHWKYIITASLIPLMKLHQELQQTCSSAMAVEERSRISYHHLSLSGRTVPKNTQFDKIYLYR